MAHAILTVGDRKVFVTDLDLIAILSLMRVELDRESDTFSGLGRRFDIIWRTVREYAPGTLDVPVNEIAASPSERAAFLALLDRVRSRVESFGSFVPEEALSSACPLPGIRWGSESSTASLVKVIDSIRGLMT